MKRVVLATGGTGGHIFPALSVAEAILQAHPEAEILFVGGTYGQEADIIARAGYKFAGLPVRGVTGRGLKAIGAVAGMGIGLLKAVSIMRRFKPQVVMGFGGYASFAGVLAAKLCCIPTAIHEQNAFPGRSNRVLGKLVNRIFLSFPDNGFFPPAKSVLVGNPVRASIQELYEEKQILLRESLGKAQAANPAGALVEKRVLELADRRNSEKTDRRQASGHMYTGLERRQQDRRKNPGDRRLADYAQQAPLESRLRARQRFLEQPFILYARTSAPVFVVPRNVPLPRIGKRFVHGRRLLVMGGSLGARVLNNALLEIMPQLGRVGIEVWHQTGAAQYEELRKSYREAGFGNVRVEAFIDKMDAAYAWADFAVCRAGGSSIAELAAAGVPSLLVPFPFATHDHQLYNAKALVEVGGAELLEQKNLQPPQGSAQKLADAIIALSMDGERLKEMQAKALSCARPMAARQMAEGLEVLSRD